MIENSSRDGRMDFDTALIQLIQANYAPRDASGRITSYLTPQEVAAKRKEVNEEEVTQGYLWLSAILSPAKQVIQFAVVDTQNISNSPVTPLNRLLTMQDSFLISNMSYFLQTYAFTGGTLNNPDFTSGHWSPVTYASTYFGGGSAAPEYSPGCDMFWIGAYLQLQIQKRVIVPYWDCYRHYKCPQTQAAPDMPNTAYIPGQQDQHDGSTDGFVYVQPNIVIGGGRTNNLYLNLAANIPATIDPFANSYYGNTFYSMAVICMRGILMQNSTTVK
jgi:hypothetical protein